MHRWRGIAGTACACRSSGKMTRHEPQTSAPPQSASHTVSQTAPVQHGMPMTASYMMQTFLPVSAGHAVPRPQSSHTKGHEISTQFKQKEATRLQKMAGRPTSSGKSAQSQMAMMQASIMQQNNMMMMQMMSQQQQRYAGNQMVWSQQRVPTTGAEVRAYFLPASSCRRRVGPCCMSTSLVTHCTHTCGPLHSLCKLSSQCQLRGGTHMLLIAVAGHLHELCVLPVP